MNLDINIKKIDNGFIVDIDREITQLGEASGELYFATYVEALEYAIDLLGKLVDQVKES